MANTRKDVGLDTARQIMARLVNTPPDPKKPKPKPIRAKKPKTKTTAK